jgi:hypothetical protein
MLDPAAWIWPSTFGEKRPNYGQEAKNYYYY